MQQIGFRKLVSEVSSNTVDDSVRANLQVNLFCCL